jgi:hypothetical protein
MSYRKELIQKVRDRGLIDSEIIDLIVSILDEQDVIKASTWKSMDTAPRNRPILVYAYSSADHPESDERHYLAVEWNSSWKQWYVLGYALDRDGSCLYAIDPIKWMEIEDDD